MSGLVQQIANGTTLAIPVSGAQGSSSKKHPLTCTEQQTSRKRHAKEADVVRTADEQKQTSERNVADERISLTNRQELNAGNPFLRLSYELHDEIASYLTAVEAICFSLTCRALYFGALSSNNSFLWYRVGGFKEGMPGYKAAWTKNGLPTLQNAGSVKGKGKAKTAKTVATFSPSAAVDYRRILVETMLGETRTGCQWCLKMGHTKMKYKNLRGLRLCSVCLWKYAINKYDLRSLKVDISSIPVQPITSHGSRKRQAVWAPSVNRLLAAAYGPNYTVATFFQERRDKIRARKDRANAFWKAKMQRHAEYRESQCRRVFESLKVVAAKIRAEAASRFDDPVNFMVERQGREKYLLSRFFSPEDLQYDWMFCDHYASSVDNWCTSGVWNKAMKETEINTKAVSVLEHRMEEVCKPTLASYQCEHTRELRKYIQQRAIEYYVARLGNTTEGLFQRAMEQGGMECPLMTCRGLQHTKYATLREYLEHVVTFHWDAMALGSLSWLEGEQGINTEQSIFSWRRGMALGSLPSPDPVQSPLASGEIKQVQSEFGGSERLSPLEEINPEQSEPIGSGSLWGLNPVQNEPIGSASLPSPNPVQCPIASGGINPAQSRSDSAERLSPIEPELFGFFGLGSSSALGPAQSESMALGSLPPLGGINPTVSQHMSSGIFSQLERTIDRREKWIKVWWPEKYEGRFSGRYETGDNHW